MLSCKGVVGSKFPGWWVWLLRAVAFGRISFPPRQKFVSTLHFALHKARKLALLVILGVQNWSRNMPPSHNTLSAASEDRKARLAQLKNLKRKQPTDEVAAPESEHSPVPTDTEAKDDVTKQYLSGRNFDSEKRGPKLGFEAPPTLGLEKQTLEQQAKDIEEGVKQQSLEDAKDDKGIDLFKLQPKKPNWDLKRNLDSKLDILNVRTDNAIAKLVRDRISASQKTDATKVSSSNDGEVDGVALVEGLRVREQEEEEEERREREDEDAM